MPAGAGRSVAVLIPLAGNPAGVAMCLKRVLDSRNATPFDVVVVAPDAKLARAFSALAEVGDARVRVVDIGHAADFWEVVDRGGALHADRDVVVLRPDASVRGNWIDR